MNNIQNNIISVITPVYNGEKFLPTLIKNFDRQTYKDFELILVNDCSTDSSGQMMRELSIGRSYIKCYDREKNGGMGPARNTGIEIATGNYIMYVDQDDTFVKNYLEIMKYIIDKDGVDIAYCGAVRKIRNGYRPLKLFNNQMSNYYLLLSANEAFKNIFLDYNIKLGLNYLIAPWAKIVRKAVYDRSGIKFPDIFVLEDFIMNFKELLNVKKVAYYNDMLYCQNVHDNNTSIAQVDRFMDCIHNVPKLISDFVQNGNYSKEILSCTVRIYFRIFKNFSFIFSRLKKNEYNKKFKKILKLYHNIYHYIYFNNILKNNEYYIYYQLLVYMITCKWLNCVEYFIEFIEPFYEIINEWSLDNDSKIFDKNKRDFMQKFLNITMSKKFIDTIFDWKYFMLRLIRKLYEFKCFFREGIQRKILDKISIKIFGCFDKNFFKDNNQDLNIENNNFFNYFIKNGWRECRNPNQWFDIKSYIENYPEIQKTGIDPLINWIINGFDDRRPF
jgi:glycosyltransferase involved in cell wall biosynthesis